MSDSQTTERDVLKIDDHLKANRDGEWVEIPGTDGEEIKAAYLDDGWLQGRGGNDALRKLLQGEDDALTAAYLNDHVIEPDLAGAIEVDELRADHLDLFKTFAVGPIVEAALSVNDLELYTAGNWKKMEQAGITPSQLSSMLANGEAGSSSNSIDSATDTTTDGSSG